MRFLLAIWGVFLLAGCAKSNGPIKLYFISSGRFTAGNKTGVGAADTLSTRLFATASPTTVASGGNSGNTLAHFNVTVTYSPRRLPFAYPALLTSFNYAGLPTGEVVTYLDSTMATPAPVDLLYTALFGARATSGTEKWVFTATDKDGNTAARSFTLGVRRADSLLVYHDYTLRLPASAFGTGDRRFIDLKSGLAFPAYSVVGNVTNPDLQKLIDVVLLPDGRRLASPDYVPTATPAPFVLSTSRWPTANRRRTRFQLTGLSTNNYNDATDTLGIRQQYGGNGVPFLGTLAIDQVYAFRTDYGGGKPYFGLMRVIALPTGTTAGLQLQIRVAKHGLNE